MLQYITLPYHIFQSNFCLVIMPINCFSVFIMDSLHKGWYTEFSPDDAERMSGVGDGKSKMMKLDGAELSGAWTGQAFSLQVDQVLFSGRSEFQDVLVLKR